MISLLIPPETRPDENSVLRKSRHVEVNSHFLEKVPVGDDFQLLEDEEDPAADEEGLVFGKSLVQQQKVALASRG